MFLRKLILPALIVMALAMTGCSSNKTEGEMQDTNMSTDQDPALGAENGSGEFALQSSSDEGAAGGLQTVNFPFDSARITGQAQASLDANVELLKSNATVDVLVEGHCDERGGIQYNLALGEKRAKAVRDYMVSKGVEDRRLQITSYGKERPLEFGHDEAAWAKNRRANFVVTSK